jgi:hypothetical protein
MIKRIIFFVVGGFSKRDYERFGIEILRENDFTVEVWDLTKVLHPQDSNLEFKDSDLPINLVAEIKTREEMLGMIGTLSSIDFVVNILSYDFWGLSSYAALSNSKAYYGVTCSNSLPVPVSMRPQNYLFKRIVEVIRNFDVDAVIRYFNRIASQTHNIKPPKLVLAGGQRSFTNQYPVDSSTEILYIHTLDYDIYLKEREQPSYDMQVAVFLDDQLTTTPELTMFGERPCMGTEKYCNLMNRFFDYIEEKTGLEVIIAVHPRADLQDVSSYYKSRKCLKGQTAHLVHGSQMTLAHCSTSINFANLFCKPIIFMTLSEIKGSLYDQLTREMAMWHGKKPVTVDKFQDIDLDNERKISIADYKHYRSSYIKAKENEEGPFWQVVCDRLKRGFENN